MRTNSLRTFSRAGAFLPYLWGFAAAAAADYLIDVRTLFLPVLVGVAAVSAIAIVARRKA